MHANLILVLPCTRYRQSSPTLCWSSWLQRGSTASHQCLEQESTTECTCPRSSFLRWLSLFCIQEGRKPAQKKPLLVLVFLITFYSDLRILLVCFQGLIWWLLIIKITIPPRWTQWFDVWIWWHFHCRKAHFILHMENGKFICFH